MNHQVLITDSSGMPKEWRHYDEAIGYYVNGKVLWEIGSKIKTFYGGINRASGNQSFIDISSIVGVSGPLLGNKFLDRSGTQFADRVILYGRDRNTCAYCGQEYPDRLLTIDHIHPKSRGGKNTWMNTVVSCRPCNNYKANRTPEEADMPLLYVPYVPNQFEKMILKNRKILADQMEFLIGRVPKHSRLHTA